MGEILKIERQNADFAPPLLPPCRNVRGAAAKNRAAPWQAPNSR